MNPGLMRLETEMLLKAPGTMYEGIGLDGQPEQGPSSARYLTLRELALSIHLDSIRVQTNRPQRSEDGFLHAGCTGARQGLADQRRCSTADQSQIRDFAVKPTAADLRV